MNKGVNRREFLQLAAAGGALYVGGSSILAFGADQEKSKIISPGCRRTKVKVARLYMAIPNNPHWPKPSLNLKDELRVYDAEFAKLKNELSDVEFAVDELISSPDQVGRIKEAQKNVDGIRARHLTIGLGAILNEILSGG